MDYLPFKTIHIKIFLLELGVSFVVINYICLSFLQIHAVLYFNYIIYSGLLIFYFQNVTAICFFFTDLIYS